MSAPSTTAPEITPFQPLAYGEWESTPEAARIADPLEKVQAYDNRLRKDLFKAGLYDADAEAEIAAAGADQALRAGLISDPAEYTPTTKPRDPNFMARQLVRQGDTAKAGDIYRYASFLGRPDTDPETLERARQAAQLDPETENELTRKAVRAGELPFAVVPDAEGNAVFEIDPELGALDRQQILDLAGDDIDPRFLPDLEKQLTRVEGTNYTPAQFRQAGVFDGFIKEQIKEDPFLGDVLERAQTEYNRTGQISEEVTGELDRTFAALDADNEFAPATRSRLIRDTIKRASKLEGYDPNEPQNSVQYLEDGSVWLPEQVIFDQAKHDQVLDSLSVTPEQKEAAKKLRAGRLESIAPAMVDAMGANPDALDFFEKSKAAGKSDSEIATEWYSKPENYSWWGNRARGIGMSIDDAFEGLVQSGAAVLGSESAREGLQARQQDIARNREYARLSGDSYGVGMTTLNAVTPVVADLLAGLLVSAVATPVAGVAVAGARTAASSLLRSMARTAIREGGRGAVRSLVRTGTESAARTLATLGDDLVSEMVRKVGGEVAERAAVRGATRAIAGQTGVAASSFTRSAGSAYVQAYSALDAQTNAQGRPLYSDEEKRKIALGTAMTAGTATAAITLGFGKILGGGVEDLVTGKIGTGILKRVFGATDDQIVSATRTSALAILQAAGAEAPEEAADQLVGNVIQALGTGEEFRLGPALKEALEAGLVGGLLGAGTKSIEVGIDKYRDAKVVALEKANAPAAAAALEARNKAAATTPAAKPTVINQDGLRVQENPPLSPDPFSYGEEDPDAQPGQGAPLVIPQDFAPLSGDLSAGYGDEPAVGITDTAGAVRVSAAEIESQIDAVDVQIADLKVVPTNETEGQKVRRTRRLQELNAEKTRLKAGVKNAKASGGFVLVNSTNTTAEQAAITAEAEVAALDEEIAALSVAPAKETKAAATKREASLEKVRAARAEAATIAQTRRAAAPIPRFAEGQSDPRALDYGAGGELTVQGNALAAPDFAPTAPRQRGTGGAELQVQDNTLAGPDFAPTPVRQRGTGGAELAVQDNTLAGTEAVPEDIIGTDQAPEPPDVEVVPEPGDQELAPDPAAVKFADTVDDAIANLAGVARAKSLAKTALARGFIDQSTHDEAVREANDKGLDVDDRAQAALETIRGAVLDFVEGSSVPEAAGTVPEPVAGEIPAAAPVPEAAAKKPTEKQIAAEMRAGKPLAVHETLFNDTISQGWVPTRNVLLAQLKEAGFGGQVYGKAFAATAGAKIRDLYPVTDVSKQKGLVFPTLDSLGFGDIKGPDGKTVKIPVFADDNTSGPFTNDPQTTAWQKNAGLSIKVPAGVAVNPAIKVNPRTGFVDYSTHNSGARIYAKGDFKRAGNTIGSYLAFQNKQGFGASLETLPPFDSSKLAGPVDFAGLRIIPGVTTEDDILRFYFAPSSDGGPSKIESAINTSASGMSAVDKDQIRAAAQLSFIRELREFTLDMNDVGSVDPKGFLRTPDGYKAGIENRIANVWSKADRGKDGVIDTSGHWNGRGRPSHLAFFVKDAIRNHEKANERRPDANVQLGSDDVDQATALERAAARNDADNAGDMLVALDEAFTPEVLRGSAAIMGMPPETGIVDVASGVQILVSRIDSVPALRKAFEQAYLATLDLPPGPNAKRAVAIQKAKAMASDELVVLASRSALVQPGVVQAVRDAGFFKSLSYGLNTFPDKPKPKRPDVVVKMPVAPVLAAPTPAPAPTPAARQRGTGGGELQVQDNTLGAPDFAPAPATEPSPPMVYEGDALVPQDNTLAGQEWESTPVSHTVAATSEQSLTPEEKAVAAKELGFPTWTPEARTSFVVRFTDWFASGGKLAVGALLPLFNKVRIIIAAGTLAMTSMISINDATPRDIRSLSPAKIAEAVATPKVKQAVAPAKRAAPVQRLVDFDGVSASSNVRVMAQWILNTKDSDGKPFVVAEKVAGVIYVFSGDGVLVKKGPALFGATPGDIQTQEQKDLTIEQRRTNKAAQVTEAGRFPSVINNTGDSYGDTAVFNPYKHTIAALHIPYLGRPAENRLGRLASPTAEDNRISLGCVNLPADMMSAVASQFKDGGIIYILPETEAGKQLYPGFANLDIPSEMPATGPDMAARSRMDSVAYLDQATIPTIREDNRAAVADLQLDGDLRSAIERIARSAKYPRRYRAVMLAALKMQVLPSISIVDAPAEAYAGSYTHSARLITLNLASSNGRGMLDVLAHELLHAATLEAIANPQTKAAKELLARLERARQKAAEVIPDDMAYAVSSLDEFTTHAATDPRLQVILRETFEKGKTTWQRVVEAVAKFFGIANNDFVSDLWGFINHAAEYGYRVGVAASREQKSVPGTDWARRDAEYLAAVEAGDLAAAQRMVDSAAQEAGYFFDGWHWSQSREGFNVFDPERGNAEGFHFGTQGAALDRRSGRSGEPKRFFLRGQYTRIVDNARNDALSTAEQLLDAGVISRAGVNAVRAATLRRENRTGRYGATPKSQGSIDEDESNIQRLEALIGRETASPEEELTREVGERVYHYRNTAEGGGSDSQVVYSASQIKSADPVTRDNAGNVIPLSARFRPSSPDIRYTIGSVHDALKTRETGAPLPRGVKTLPGMSDNPESNTVEKQFENLDEIFATIPNPIASSGSWITFMRAIGKQLGKKTPVPIAPDRAVGYSAGQGFDHIMVDLKQHPEYVEARTQGLATGTRMLEDFRSGKLGRQDLASLFLWGLFSRGIGAYPQEGAFSAIHRAGLLDNLELVFTNQMTPVELRDWALDAAKGSPVGGAHRNVKALDAMLNALTHKFDGRPAIDVLLDAWKSDMTGPELRREVYRMFTKDRPSLQIQNKVLSFIILVSGRPDVLVLDRVQFRHLWGGEKLESIISRFQEKLVKAKAATSRRADVKSSSELKKAVADVVPERTDNVYDRLPVIVTPEAEAKAIEARAEIKAFGSFWATVFEFANPKPAGTFGFVKVSGKKKVARSGLVGLGNGLHGLAAYEALERGLSAATEQAYRDAGIEYPGIGAFHWDSWLVSSRQAISHPTLELIAGSRDPNTSVMEGKFNTINYGMLYRYDGMYMRELLTNPGHYVMLTPEAAKDAYTTAAVNKALGRKGKNQLKLKKSEELEDDEDGPQERTRPWTEDLSPAERSAFDKWLRTLGPTVEPDPDAIADGDPDERGDAGFEDRPDEAVRAALTPEGAAPDGSRGSVDQFLPTLPGGVSYSFDDTRPKYLAFARRSQPGVVTINKQALAAVIAGLSPANARAIVSKIVKHEIAHLAAFSTFTDADIAEMARGMSAHEINEVARRYYDSPDALARLDADLESGAITNEALVEEYLRMQLELATDGATTEATIAFHSNNPGFVARLVRYLKDALVALWRNVAGPQEDYVNRIAISRLAREYRAILRGHKPLRAEPFDPADPNRDTRAALAPQTNTDPDADAAIREIFTESLEDFTKPYEPGSLWRRLFVVRTGDRRFPAISDKRQSSLVANERLVFARRKQLEKTIKEEQPDAQVLTAAAGDSSPTTTPEQDAYIAEEFAAALEEARGIEDPAEQASAVAEAYALKQRLTTTAYAETARIKKRRIDEAFEELERAAPKTAANLKAMREGIDNISRIVKEYQPESSPLRMVFDTQDGIYLTRVYRIHHKDGDPLSIFSDPAMADVREAAQDQLMASLIDIRVAEIIEQEAEAGKIIGDTEAREIAIAEAEEQDLGRILLEDYLLAHGSKALPHNGTDFRIDLTRYFKKMPVPEALRNVLEEVTDPVELLTRTSLNVGMLAASTVFTRDLARGGYTSGAMVTGTQQRMYRKLIQEPDNDKYLAMLVDGGWAKRVTAPGYVEIAPDVHIPGWLVKAKEERDLTYLENFRQVATTTKKFGAGKLADLYAHPNVADWMDHQFTRPKAVSLDDAKFVQKMGEVFAKATGMSLGVATLGSVGFYTRNFVGNAFFLAANGINPFSGKTKRASDLAMKAFLNRESGEVTKLTGLGVLNDDLRPETIKELLKGETDRPGGLNILELIGKVLGGKKGIEYGTKTTAGLAKLADAATAIDGIAKATTYYTELETLREAYPEKSNKWLEDEAAKIVKLTNQAKSQTPPIVDSLTSSSYGRLFASFLRFKGEIFRLTGNIIAQSAAEIKSDNPVIRTRGLKRAAGFAMISAFSVAGPALISAMYGIGEDEEFALREALPPYLRGNSLIYLPSEDGKSVTSIDLSYLQPYSFIGDPISRVGRAVMRGEPGEGVDELAIWLNSNFLSEQILAGAAMEVLRNRTSDDKPITFETDDATEKLLKYSKHLVGSSFTPQSLKSLQRSYDAARRGTPDDAPFFETPAGILIGHGMPVRPRAFETESLALRAARKQAETNRQVRALAGQLKRRVNYTEGDIEDIVADLQDSTASLNVDIARMISGYEGLGLPKASIAKQLVEAGRSRQFARAITFRGVAAGPTITPATKRDLFEAGEAAGGAGGGEKRTKAVSEAMRQYPKTQQVRVVPQD